MFEIVNLPSSETLQKLAERYPALEISAIESWLELMRVSDDCMVDLDGFLSEHSLSPRRFFVLVLLLRIPQGLNISQLAEGTGVSCATMSGVVEGLLKAELVTREADPQDRRVFVVRITDAGLALLDGILPAHYRRVSRIMSCLNEEERLLLRSLLGKVREGLKEGGNEDKQAAG